VGYGQCGNLIQDVAAIKSLRLLTEKYLAENGFPEVKVTTVLHQWMGGFPQDEAKAFGVISWGAAAAALSGATKVIVKTPHEALGIPSKEANAQGLKTTKQVVSMLSDQRLLNQAEVNAEVEVITAEVAAILKTTLELGDGDYAQGAVRAFAAGAIDVPFAPSKYNAGKILTARDLSGAVRFLETGRLPFPDDLKDFHRQKLEERSKAERRPVSFQMVIDDIYAIGKGFLVGKPR
jgi:methylaspartate mutase epsilon subunit